MATNNSLALKLNDASPESAAELLQQCCASSNWIQSMLNSIPFTSNEHVLKASEAAFSLLTKEDWLEAFSAHPKIGDVNSLRKKYADTARLAASEQSGVKSASEEVIQRLAKANTEYFDRFGFIFIICATGKSASEMLAALETRLANTAEQELTNAGLEQTKITALRLNKIGLDPMIM